MPDARYLVGLTTIPLDYNIGLNHYIFWHELTYRTIMDGQNLLVYKMSEVGNG